MNLSELKIGEKAKIKTLDLDSDMTRRLWDLGFTKGTEIEAIQASPSGDPVAYRVRGTIFAVRKKDAMQVELWEVESHE
ncbi:FeoA family protein [Vagococcus silagei]|uniref:Ferrous iron transport protein A n=1 Tax=Vagococcus silagei TaxID=2508885 RepID=A0A4S3B3E3_9ENTE|nr:FeoA family protein [Vagococcus silagei]THB60948.1 ferrous iron transport protein A [Vagococcus silagei]